MLGVRIVLVYGARPQINLNLSKHHCESSYHKGIRVTNEDALGIAMQAAGQLQLAITARLSMSLRNTPMQGTQLNVASGNFIIAQCISAFVTCRFTHGFSWYGMGSLFAVR